MSGAKRGLMLLAVLVAMMAGWVNTAAAQIATTTVQDTVYSANGTPASGTVLVSWNAFTTASGQSVPSGTTSVTIGAGGLLTIALAPNAGSTPMGSYYTAVFHLSDGTTSREYWVVPVTVPGGGTATLAAIKNQVLPISVAMQTVSKAYVDDAIAAAASGFPLASSPYVLTAGDAMSGPLLLPADPVSPNQAADKNYVDTSVAAAAGGLGQKVSLLPTATQAVAQPTGTNFSINGAYASTTFSSTGTSSQSTITPATATANPNASGYTLSQNQLNCFQQGFDLGNNGTSAQGWSGCTLNDEVFESATRGIFQLNASNFSHFAQGDTAAFYTYLTSFGGHVASSDEGVEHTVMQTHQMGYFKGSVATGGTLGSNLVTVNSFGCNGYCQTLDNEEFADGGILLDTSHGGATATISTQGRALNGMYYTLGTGTVTPSTAFGNIVLGSCTNNGNGQFQAYTATTCNIQLATSPASSGNFVAGTDVCLSGPFEEEAAVTAVGSNVGGVQSITFNTRYGWDNTNGNTNAALVMQGGPCGQSLVASSTEGTWPVAYAVVGATSSTQLFFSNCVAGYCNGTGGAGNIIQPAVSIETGSPNMTRASNVVTFTTNQPYYFAVGSSVVVTGMTPSDLDGTFTVLSNTYDSTPGDNYVTWAQTGANETSTAGSYVSQAPVSITFYPSAFITGTNGGVVGAAQLATNIVPFTTGDTVVGAPTSEFNNTALRIVQGQTTSIDGSWPSAAVSVSDDGPSPFEFAFSATNNTTNGPATEMFNATGSYGKYFNFGFRPANNGTIIFVQGGEPVSANHKPYNIFEDNAGGGTFGYAPATNVFSLSGPLIVPQIVATNMVSEFAAGSTVGGILPCLQNGTDCPAGGSGTGTLTSVAVGTWPSWLTPTVTNATTTPTVAVVASPIPNAALANSATTVNGQTCALGNTCTITAAPPTDVKYYQAAVCDGGTAYASGVTRYDNQQPQAGCVLPGSSALAYLAFNAASTLPQYAEATVSTPPYWTSTSLYFNFYSAAVTGTVTWEIQTACIGANSVVGSPNFGAAVPVTTTVSPTAGGNVITALVSGIATPGVNGCPSTPTTPGLLTYRIYRSATDTAAGSANLLGTTLVTGRSE